MSKMKNRDTGGQGAWPKKKVVSRSLPKVAAYDTCLFMEHFPCPGNPVCTFIDSPPHLT